MSSSWLLLLALPLAAAELPYGKLFSDGPRGARAVALTFDDGPGASTPDLLDLLKDKGLKATFFVLGREVRTHPGLVKRMAAEGHQVACHTDTHPNFAKVAEAEREALLRREIDRCREAVAAEIAEIAGPVEFMRMPHGYDRPWVKAIAAEKKLVLVNWTYGSDWTRMKEEEMIRDYRKHARPGSILLMHDGGIRGGTRTVHLVTALLDTLKEKGLEPVRVDDLLGLQADKKVVE